MSLKKITSILLSIVFFAVPVATFGSISACQHQTPPPQPVTINSSISVRVNGVNRPTLYSFLTDIRNDNLWYPGIISTELVQEGGKHGIGRIYEQSAVAGPITTHTTIEVIDAKTNNYFQIQGDGDIADFTALYTFKALPGGATEWTMTSTYIAPGFTEETFTQYIVFALSGLIDYYGNGGEVIVNYVNVN